MLVCDESNILVGVGGTVAEVKPGQEPRVVDRQGSHLFGGSIDTNDFLGSKGAPAVRQAAASAAVSVDTRPTRDQIQYLADRDAQVAVAPDTDLRFDCPSPVLRAAVREFKQETRLDLDQLPTAKSCVIRFTDGRFDVYGIVHKVNDVGKLIKSHEDARTMAGQAAASSASAVENRHDSPFAELKAVAIHEAAEHPGFKEKGTDWFKKIVVRAQAIGALSDRSAAAPAPSSSISPAASASASAAVSTTTAAIPAASKQEKE
jgi:hypothetical protein